MRGDRCLDIYRRSEKKSLPRSCLPTEIFIERVRLGQGASSFAAARDAKPRSDSSKHEQGRKQPQTSPVKRSPVKNLSPMKTRGDPSPIDIWRERHRARQAALLHSAREKNYFMDADDDMGTQDSNIDMERASMMR